MDHPSTQRSTLQNTLRNAANVSTPESKHTKPNTNTEPSDPFVTMDAMAQAELVRTREVSPLELVDAAIKRIEAMNPAINAVIHPMFDLAREQAKSGNIPDGPFRGVPYLIKDLSDIKGQPLEYGSRLFKGYKAKKDIGIVKTARQSGLVILGKTNTPEFGLMATTEPLLHGPTRNPWNLAHHTGGSSGGSAAAVASGMVPFAQADDGGGSIRIPASICGLVGLKPSRGRDFITWGEDKVMPADILCRLGVSRTVRDTAQLLNVSERKGKKAIFEPTGFVSGPSSKRLKIAVSTRSEHQGTPAHPDVQAAIENTAQLCADLGHEVVEAQPLINGEEFSEHFMGIWASTPYKLAKYAKAIGLLQFKWTSAEEGLEPLTLGLADWLKMKEKQKSGVIKRSLKYFEKIESICDEFYMRYDAHLSPTLRTPPVLIGEQSPDVKFETVFERMLDYAAYTPLHNTVGATAITLPLFTSAAGLPIGSQFSAGRGYERRLLELAYELEEAKPWADRWAPNSAFYR